jgi:hypothetical protein
VRFLVHRAGDAVARSRPPVRVFLVFAALAVLGLAAQRVLNGGLTPSGVEAFYVAAGEPLPAVALWEEVHTGAFVYGFVLLMLGSLLAVCPLTPRARGPLLGAAVAATLADLFAPFLVVRVDGTAALRVVTFVAAMLTVSALLVVVATRYGRTPRRGDA